MKPIQFLFLAFVAFAAAKVMFKYRAGQISKLQLLFWIVVWSSAAFIINIPAATTFIAALLGIGRGVDLIIYVSFLAVFYLIFRIHLVLNRIDQEITQIVRSMALEHLREPRQADARQSA